MIMMQNKFFTLCLYLRSQRYGQKTVLFYHCMDITNLQEENTTEQIITGRNKFQPKLCFFTGVCYSVRRAVVCRGNGETPGTQTSSALKMWWTEIVLMCSSQHISLQRVIAEKKQKPGMIV